MPDVPTASSPADSDLAAPLGAGRRYRCDGCGNVTRFDVVTSARTRRYLHFDLGGASAVDEEEVLDTRVESVTCRWCARGDSIRIEPTPGPSSGAAGS